MTGRPIKSTRYRVPRRVSEIASNSMSKRRYTARRAAARKLIRKRSRRDYAVSRSATCANITTIIPANYRRGRHRIDSRYPASMPIDARAFARDRKHASRQASSSELGSIVRVRESPVARPRYRDRRYSTAGNHAIDRQGRIESRDSPRFLRQTTESASRLESSSVPGEESGGEIKII